MTTTTSGRTAARSAGTSFGPNITTRVATASIPTATTPSANAPSPAPEYPGFEADLVNCPRHTAICTVCKEPWFRGTCDMPGYTYGTPPVALCKHEEAEHRYWKHIRESERHQAILQVRARGVTELLDALPAALNTAKVHQKLMRDPAFTPLRSLFR